jgi:dTDP-4-amino-4,6-dideoxyglucose formyltransferase
MTHRVLVITDNAFAKALFESCVVEARNAGVQLNVSYRFSPGNKAFLTAHANSKDFTPLNVRRDWSEVVGQFDLVFSAHCKQLFPAELVNQVRCVNLHPGLNPHNRGWYPQAFSILNGLPLGATLHRMDAELDHGAMYDQEPVTLVPWDTSLSAYEKVQAAEAVIMRRSFRGVLEDTMPELTPGEGNLNLRADFDALREIDLNQTVTFQQAIDRLRALTHGNFNNAYFTTLAGRKVWVRLALEPDAEQLR